jgi:hypothetical protein
MTPREIAVRLHSIRYACGHPAAYVCANMYAFSTREDGMPISWSIIPTGVSEEACLYGKAETYGEAIKAMWGALLEYNQAQYPAVADTADID